jgi:hypothetical protein
MSLSWDGDKSSQFEGFENRSHPKLKEANMGEIMIISNLSKEFIQRPAVDGFIELQRKFHAYDVDGNRLISLLDFTKVTYVCLCVC